MVGLAAGLGAAGAALPHGRLSGVPPVAPFRVAIRDVEGLGRGISGTVAEAGLGVDQPRCKYREFVQYLWIPLDMIHDRLELRE